MRHVWERGEVHTGFGRETFEGKRLLGKLRHRWENNIKIVFKMCYGGLDCINLAEDRDR
jgi:hypothetical protein